MKSASLLRFPVTPSGAALRSLPTGVAAKLDQPFLTPSPPFLTPSPPFLAQAELAGRLVEVTGQGASARISWLAGLVAAAQREGETVAWLQLCVGSLYPPDLVRLGIDLTKLSVALLPDATALLRGADILLRTGGFGLCIVDWEEAPARPTDAQLGRLLGLAQKHAAAVVFLTRTDATPLGSLISLRIAVRREPRPGDGFAVVAEVVKDKRRGDGRLQELAWQGPEGIS